MFTYNYLLSACRELSLDVQKSGNNIYAKFRPVEAFEKPVDISSLQFKGEIADQVSKIGKLIYNLVSQKKFPAHYNLSTPEGKKENKRDAAIDKILPVLEEAQAFWFKKGLSTIKGKKRELILHNGFVFEVDPAYKESMDEMNKCMREVKREFLVKQKRSEEGAARIILM